jgi:hypothetical protein
MCDCEVLKAASLVGRVPFTANQFSFNIDHNTVLGPVKIDTKNITVVELRKCENFLGYDSAYVCIFGSKSAVTP